MDGVKTIINDMEWLRKKSFLVDLKNDDIAIEADLLKKFCLNNEVFAMAAIQLGIDKRIIFVKNTRLDKVKRDDWNEDYLLINPVIKKREGLVWYWENCASCLDNMGLVLRPYKIVVEYFDIHGKKHKKTFKEFRAVVISHEYDHLDGILHMDRALKVYDMEVEKRVEFRKTHPYKVFFKEGSYEELEKEYYEKYKNVSEEELV
ncbi:MAG: peptide deformylase [Bacilli bacterium]|nr:peptide deformylase [Bacilli bacterium]